MQVKASKIYNVKSCVTMASQRHHHGFWNS